MRVGKRTKQKQKYLPRHCNYSLITVGKPEPTRRPRKDATYFSDWCCRMCYFDWGISFDRKHLYKHNCAESNYDGLLKKYWKSPDRFSDGIEQDESSY